MIYRAITDRSIPAGYAYTNDPIFRVNHNDHLEQCDFCALACWRVTPIQQYVGELRDVLFRGSNQTGNPSNFTLENEQAQEFMNRFLQRVWDATDGDQRIVEARRLHQHLLDDGTALRDKIRCEIEQWTK